MIYENVICPIILILFKKSVGIINFYDHLKLKKKTIVNKINRIPFYKMMHLYTLNT